MKKIEKMIVLLNINEVVRDKYKWWKADKKKQKGDFTSQKI